MEGAGAFPVGFDDGGCNADGNRRSNAGDHRADSDVVTFRHAIVTGIMLGIVAGLVVWYLERFQTDRMFSDMRDYMEKRDDFRAWLQREGRE